MSPRDISPKGQTQERSETHVGQSSVPEQGSQAHHPGDTWYTVPLCLGSLLQPGLLEYC